MNKDQWNHKKSRPMAAPAERAQSGHTATGGTVPSRSASLASEVIAAVKRAGAFDRSGDGSWNQWQP